MEVSCPSCRQNARIAFRATDKNRAVSAEEFSYYRCSACNLFFLRPIPDDLGRYYPEEYHPIPASSQELAQSAQSELFKVEMIRRFVPAGCLLEIGSSYGGFAYLAGEAGYQVDVIEMSASCCDFLNTFAKVNAIQSDDPILTLQDRGQYDVIALWHVIEHLPDPWKLIDSAICHLNTGGILVIAAPNPQSLQFRIFGQNWMHLDAPRHLHLIPYSNLRQQFNSRGVDEVFMTTTDQQGLACNAAGWAAGWNHSFAIKAKNRWQRKLVSLVARIIIFVQPLFRTLERKGLNGAAYTLIGRKNSILLDESAQQKL